MPLRYVTIYTVDEVFLHMILRNYFLYPSFCTVKLFCTAPHQPTPPPVNRDRKKNIDWYLSRIKKEKGDIFGSAAGVIPRPNMKRNGRLRSVDKT